MSEAFLCSRQEECPVVLAACERKVKAEALVRITEAKVVEKEAEYAKKRTVMNELFSAGVAMRKAQTEYFKNRTQTNLAASKSAEARFDRALADCRALGKPQQETLKGI